MASRESHDEPDVAEEMTPFDTIESAQEYVSLLALQVDAVKVGLSSDIAEAQRERPGRSLDALHLVDYKLSQLSHHLAASGRILNDLRALRRLLLGERRTGAHYFEKGVSSQ